MKVNPFKRAENDDLMAQYTIEEQAYDISPYKGSDDEDEDEDDDDSKENNKKFVPAWARFVTLFPSSKFPTLGDHLFRFETFIVNGLH